LGGKVAVTSGDTKEKAVEFLKGGGVGDGLDVGGLGGSVHLRQDLLGKGLLDSSVGLDKVLS
jgi:hypothetical protein